MATVTKQILKSYFETNDKPTQGQFSDTIDTLGASFSLVNSTIISDYNTDIVLKGATSGTTYWASLIGQIENFDDDLAGSSIDSDGTNIFVIGANENTNQCLIVKLDLSGNVIWQKEIVENSFGECVICKNGYVWLFYTDYDNGNNISIIQLDTDANLIGNWNFTTDIYTAYGYEIDVDEDNNVYFVGYQSNDVNQQIVVGKLNTLTSTIDWVYNIGDVDGEQGFGIKYKNGFVYSSGYDVSTANGVISKWDTDGNLIWSKTTTIPVAGLGITVDEAGNVYCAGSSNFSTGVLFALDTNGNKIYCNVYATTPISA